MTRSRHTPPTAARSRGRGRPAPWLMTLALALGGGAAQAQVAGSSAVARSSWQTPNGAVARGTVFFIPVLDDIGVAAVGAAHSFDLVELADAGEVSFDLPRSDRHVTVSSRYLVPPGRPFRTRGGTLRDDYVVFALDRAPDHVRVLEPSRDGLRPGARVKLLGIPQHIPQDEDDIFGAIVEVSDTRFEIDLDVPVDLRGWGGAPVVSASSGRVIGILEAAWPMGNTLRVGAAPISGVLDALRSPLADGLGRPFSDFRAQAVAVPEVADNPFAAPRPPSPPPGTQAPGPPPARPQPARTTAPPGGRRAPRLPEGEALLGAAGPREAELRLEIEQPDEDAIIGSDIGAFVAGQAIALLGEFRRFDVVFVLDTSGSTNEPTGADVNGNGVVGQPRLGTVGAIFGMGSSDPGDSILAAEVAAARRLLRSLDARSTRIALVTFAGQPAQQGGFSSRRMPQAAITEEPLTSDYRLIDDGLERILRRGADGMTHMAAGVDQATIELLGLRGGISENDPDSEKVVLFFTDGEPTLPYENYIGDNVRAVLRASDRARRAGVRIHSFAIGPEALQGPIATVEMAARTNGYFTPVRDPGDLVQVVEGVSFANIEEISIRNLTTEEDASHVLINADGSWSALVPVAPGKNQLEVVAVAGDGSRARATRTIQHAPGAPDPELPRALIAQRNRLLERRVVELRRERVEAERERAEEARKSLKIEIERERAEAAARAERQRKELDLEVETGTDGP